MMDQSYLQDSATAAAIQAAQLENMTDPIAQVNLKLRIKTSIEQ